MDSAKLHQGSVSTVVSGQNVFPIHQAISKDIHSFTEGITILTHRCRLATSIV